MGKTIVITSGKGGVGKTTATANIGTGLAVLGNKVVVVDTDIGLRNLDVVMGLENRIVYDIVDVVEKTCRLKQGLIRDKRYEGLFCYQQLKQGQDSYKARNDVGASQSIKEEFDYIILIPSWN